MAFDIKAFNESLDHVVSATKENDSLLQTVKKEMRYHNNIPTIAESKELNEIFENLNSLKFDCTVCSTILDGLKDDPKMKEELTQKLTSAQQKLETLMKLMKPYIV